jgi:thioredoxin reductase (NADPH)
MRKGVFMLDVVIIGAGPAGLSAAIEAQRSRLNYVVIEKGGVVNSIQQFPTAMAFFSTPELLEIGGIPFTSSSMRPTRADGLEYYIKVAEYFKLQINLFEEVISVRKAGQSFEVKTSKSSLISKNVIVATGYFDNPNLLNIPGEELPKVSHYYSEPFSSYRRNVAVVGGKNSAAIAALELYRHGAAVTLIHRKEKLSDGIKYWVLPDIENRIKEGSIAAHFLTEVKEIRTESIVLENKNRGRFSIPNDFVFALIGYHPDITFLRAMGVETNPETMAPIYDEGTMETNIRGLYIAGSIAAGKNNNKIFIENGRLHGKSIIPSLLK